MYAGILYLLAIVGVNLGFSHLPMVGQIPMMTFFVGVVFILRDYVQRAVGHESLIFMAIGSAISFTLADPRVAMASVIAFTFSEGIEWSIFTVTKKPFKDRMLLSVAISVPFDSVIFLFGIGHLTFTTAVAMSLSKMVFAGLLWLYYRICEMVEGAEEQLNEAADDYYNLTNRQH